MSDEKELLEPCPFCNDELRMFDETHMEHTMDSECPLAGIYMPAVKWNTRSPAQESKSVKCDENCDFAVGECKASGGEVKWPSKESADDEWGCGYNRAIDDCKRAYEDRGGR